MTQNITLEKKELSRKQRAAIRALVAEGTGTVTEAAKRAGVARATLARWTRQKHFIEALREAEAEQLALVGARTSALMIAALDVLGPNMGPGVDGSYRLRAALAMLRHGPQLRQWAEIEERVSELEKVINDERN